VAGARIVADIDVGCCELVEGIAADGGDAEALTIDVHMPTR
jgi:hypothetical protein